MAETVLGEITAKESFRYFRSEFFRSAYFGDSFRGGRIEIEIRNPSISFRSAKDEPISFRSATDEPKSGFGFRGGGTDGRKSEVGFGLVTDKGNPKSLDVRMTRRCKEGKEVNYRGYSISH